MSLPRYSIASLLDTYALLSTNVEVSVLYLDDYTMKVNNVPCCRLIYVVRRGEATELGISTLRDERTSVILV